MNAIQLSKKIGMIDRDLIEESANAHKLMRKNTWIKWSVGVAAAVCISAGFAVFINHGLGNHPFQPAASKVNQAKAVKSIEYSRSNHLDIINCSFNAKDMGGGSYGHLIVKDYSDIATANPTRNNVEGIAELPVFKNERGLWSDTVHDISNIKAKIYFDNPMYEITRNYNFDGTSNNTWNLCFKNDKSKNITDQLLDYTFYRIQYAVYNLNGKISGWSKTLKPPAKPGTLYPIISESDAEQKFRKGEFFSYGNEAEVAKTANIISVELEYLTDEYQAYIQPFYVFMINDKSWRLSPMQCKNKKDFTSVSPVFVPAVVDKYLNITEPTIEFN